MQLSEDAWKQKLTTKEYQVLRLKGTDPAFSGDLTDEFEDGKYTCAACGTELFTSDTKYHSGCGWPSFYAATNDSSINETKDYSHGMVRVEITCKNCGGHLGHIFDDGPKPTGLRYCVNSTSIKFKAKK